MSPAPTPVHQQILAELYDHVKPFVRRRKLGVVLFAPLDIVIQRRPKLRTRQPDLVFFSVRRYGRRLRERFGSAPIEFAPDLAVEILSTSDHRRALPGKLEDYAAIGIPEVWLLSPVSRTIEVQVLVEGRYERKGMYPGGENLSSTVLPGFALDVDTVLKPPL